MQSQFVNKQNIMQNKIISIITSHLPPRSKNYNSNESLKKKNVR